VGVDVLLAVGTGGSAPYGLKGVSSMMQWMVKTRTNGDTLNSESLVVAGDVALPWISPAPTY
jgi:ubiquinone biosynthesis protein UbiJ